MATFRRRPGPRGSTVWQAQIIRLGFPRQYRTFNIKGAAEAWARQTETEMDTGAWQDRVEGDRTSVTDALGRYLVEITPGKAPTTAANERTKILRLQKCQLSRFALSRLSGRDVAKFIHARLKEDVKPATVVSELAILSHMYTVARSAWGMPYLINPVPLARSVLPKMPHGRERRLQEGEEERLLKSASPIITEVIRFALATTMRRSEIASLVWNCVDFGRRAILLPEAKNDNARSVPLSPAALKVLKSIPRRFDGSVFGLSAAGISSGWKRAVKAAGIDDFRFHDLRHEGISRLFEDTDLDMMEVREITGHLTLQMLVRYTHLRTHRLADRLAGAARGR